MKTLLVTFLLFGSSAFAKINDGSYTCLTTGDTGAIEIGVGLTKSEVSLAIGPLGTTSYEIQDKWIERQGPPVDMSFKASRGESLVSVLYEIKSNAGELHFSSITMNEDANGIYFEWDIKIVSKNAPSKVANFKNSGRCTQ